MAANFIQYDQDQKHLLPKDFAEWVEKDSLKRLVSDTIDSRRREKPRTGLKRRLMAQYWYSVRCDECDEIERRSDNYLLDSLTPQNV
jgi:hypothetical protein